MMLFLVPDSGAVSLFGSVNELKHSSYALVKTLHRELSAVYSFNDEHIVLSVACRHFKVKSCLDTERSVINSAPVAHYKAFIAPVISENISQQILVLR